MAILDDDDEWDDDHLQLNTQGVAAAGADLSVSGLRMHVGGIEQPRPLIHDLDDRGFLIGNPGIAPVFELVRV